jgi:hypothetical protein
VYVHVQSGQDVLETDEVPLHPALLFGSGQSVVRQPFVPADVVVEVHPPPPPPPTMSAACRSVTTLSEKTSAAAPDMTATSAANRVILKLESLEIARTIHPPRGTAAIEKKPVRRDAPWGANHSSRPPRDKAARNYQRLRIIAPPPRMQDPKFWI